jgi:hypothetical protein
LTSYRILRPENIGLTKKMYSLVFYIIFSCVRSSVTNNNGFWIGWLDLLKHLLQSLLIIINMTVHNQWLSKSRSISYWTTSVFSTVTGLVLIYESVTSSAASVRWLTLHNWTLNSTTELSYEFWMSNVESLANECVVTWPTYITSGRTEYKSPLQTVPLLLCAYPLLRKSVSILWLRSDFHKPIHCCGNVSTESLSSSGHLCSASLIAHF